VCADCINDIPATLNQLGFTVKEYEHKFKTLQEICRSCTGFGTLLDVDSQCSSLDCSVFYQRMKANQKVRLVPVMETIMNDLEQKENEERMNGFLESFK
jgi:hypothetical protein